MESEMLVSGTRYFNFVPPLLMYDCVGHPDRRPATETRLSETPYICNNVANVNLKASNIAP